MWVKSKNESDLKIELVNGSMIELKGTENAMALRGRSLSGCVLDEAAFMDSGYGLKCSDQLSPTNKDGPSLSPLPKAPPAGSTTFGVSLERKTMTGKGGPTQPSRGEMFHPRRWRLHVHNLTQEHSARNLRPASKTSADWSPSTSPKKTSPNQSADIPQLPLWIGLDFNVDNMSAVFGIRVDEELHIFDELIMVNATTWDMADEINHRFTLERRKDICPDPTGAARKTAGVGFDRPRHPPQIRPQSINPPLPLENPRQSQLRQHRHPRLRWSAPPKNPPPLQRDN